MQQRSFSIFLGIIIRSFFQFLAFGLILFEFSPSLWAQKHGNVWYFGKNAGIDFSSGSPQVLFDGVIDNFEGVASDRKSVV